jgi:prepilin-type N-terminal cleavage/methylation domain-containing protein
MRTNQKGSTLIELLVVVAISGSLIVALVPFIFNITKASGAITDELTGMLQVQNAARWISRDVKLAADINLTDGAQPVDNLTVQWIDMYEGINQEHTIQYYVIGEELKRDMDSVVITVARYISDIEFSRNGSDITIDITCTPEDQSTQSERGIYHVTLRQ